jgi:hypothetical protein
MSPKDSARVEIELKPEKLQALIGLEYPGLLGEETKSLPSDINCLSGSSVFSFTISNLQIRSHRQSRRQLVLNVLRDPPPGAVKDAKIQGFLRDCHVFRGIKSSGLCPMCRY